MIACLQGATPHFLGPLVALKESSTAASSVLGGLVANIAVDSAGRECMGQVPGLISWLVGQIEGSKKRNQVLRALWRLAQRREYHLQMKALGVKAQLQVSRSRPDRSRRLFPC